MICSSKLIVYGEINDINLDEQIISVGNSKIDYDELVIGLGCESSTNDSNFSAFR
jgi:NADH dehydrogenase FAD-containing subunit